MRWCSQTDRLPPPQGPSLTPHPRTTDARAGQRLRLPSLKHRSPALQDLKVSEQAAGDCLRCPQSRMQSAAARSNRMFASASAVPSTSDRRLGTGNGDGSETVDPFGARPTAQPPDSTNGSSAGRPSGKATRPALDTGGHGGGLGGRGDNGGGGGGGSGGAGNGGGGGGGGGDGGGSDAVPPRVPSAGDLLLLPLAAAAVLGARWAFRTRPEAGAARLEDNNRCSAARVRPCTPLSAL